MRSIRILPVVAAVALVVAACTTAPASATAPKAFQLDKTCIPDEGCTVASSNLDVIPPGTRILYKKVGDGSAGLKNATITVDGGSATGVCDFNQSEPLTAKCTFLSGTGKLSGFHLLADVTLTGDPKVNGVWHWVGTFWYGD